VTGHTPGPWELQGIEWGGDERGEAFIFGADLGGLVGAALPWPTERDSGDFSRVRANGRLMAAAPDLLAALKDVVSMILSGGPSVASMSDTEVLGLGARINAAIAKAEGR
jgi:hypothetical protein